MVLINYATKEIVAKVVYYGPALCGKTTNLQYIYTKMNPKKRGKMISLATESDRTLFFDFLPMELGKVGGFKVRFQLYTVPGQVFYGATRKLVLKGADAIVFVADSQEATLDMNLEAIQDMKHNLMENNLDPETIPLVIQYNKRDLNGIMEVEELERTVNWRGVPYTEAVAITGPGVMDTFKEITRALIDDLRSKHSLMSGDAIKDLPPEVFQEYEPPKQEEVLDAEDIVFEIEHGSGYQDEEEGEGDAEVVSGELLDMVETISLADAAQAEAFFDGVRQGVSAEEAKEMVLSAEPLDSSIELSEVPDAGDGSIIMQAQAHEFLEPEREGLGEREMTPDELDFADDGRSGPPLDSTSIFDMDLPEPPAADIVPPSPPEPKAPPVKAEPSPRQPATEPPKPAAPAPAPQQQAAPAAPATPASRAVDDAKLDRKFDAVQDTLAKLAVDLAMLGSRVDKGVSQPAPQAAPVDVSPELYEIRESLGRIEQEVSALRMSMTLLKEATSNSTVASAGGGDTKAALEDMRRDIKEAFEGQDRLLLKILEASRETKLANGESHEKLEDALKYIINSIQGDERGGKKKWF